MLGAVNDRTELAMVRACRRRWVARRPVWFMRQAGRSLPEYRAARGEGDILAAIAQPELAAELALQPVHRYGVDAAVLFSDIVVPLHGIGFGVEVVPGRGPVIEKPFASPADLDRLRQLDPTDDIPYVERAARMVRSALAGADVAVVALAGGPFTLASYMIEGGSSRTFGRTKALMHGQPDLWASLMDRLADLTSSFAEAQLAGGADVVQLFDSWAGYLSPSEYERFVLPATRRIMADLGRHDVARILFGVGTGELLGLMATTGADVIGVDWRVPLAEARRRIGPLAVQGNLDPAVCLAPWTVVEHEARRVIDEAGPEPGHIFNLGHGVLPETDPGILAAVVDLVHAQAPQGSGTVGG
jgi:uroporphyrinogen decarboxylase